MQCPECKSTHIRKNGINKQGKQNQALLNSGMNANLAHIQKVV